MARGGQGATDEDKTRPMQFKRGVEVLRPGIYAHKQRHSLPTLQARRYLAKHPKISRVEGEVQLVPTKACGQAAARFGVPCLEAAVRLLVRHEATATPGHTRNTYILCTYGDEISAKVHA